MSKARFEDIKVTDLTSDFLTTARSWHEQYSRHEADVEKALGRTWLEERQVSRAALLQGIEDGLLRRLLVSGRAI
ncbi:MAG: hypothetical protein ACLGIB_10695 [Actinomycetota bacterium]